MNGEYYTSFLVCLRPNCYDVYQEGLPIGVLNNGVFNVHHHVMPNGDRIPAKIDNDMLNTIKFTIDQIQSTK